MDFDEQSRGGSLHENSLMLFERRAQASVLVGDRLYYWGGIVVVSECLPEDSSSEEDSDDSEEDSSFPTVQGIPPNILRVRKSLPLAPKNLIDVYDIKQKLWFQYPTGGDVPPPDYGAAMCELDGFIYLFGGYNNLHFSSTLYQLDVTSMTWLKMKVNHIAPSPVYRTALVPCRKGNRLIAFGGVSERISAESLQLTGAEYVENSTSPHSYGYNNEYHEYSVTEGCWVIPSSVAGRPGPRCGHAVTVVDSCRAVLYGGVCGNFIDELYVLDMETKTFYSIAKPISPDSLWPLPRSFHQMCSLTAMEEADEGSVVKVLLMWGRDTRNTVADETGVFVFSNDLTKAKFEKYSLPLVPRYWHTVNVYCVTGSKEVLIFAFGGNFSSETERFGSMVRSEQSGLRLWRGDFRVLQWGSDFPKLCSLCLDAISANFSNLSTLLLSLRGSTVLAEVQEHHRKKGYYSPILIEANCAPGDGGSSSTQFLSGVGYGRAVPK